MSNTRFLVSYLAHVLLLVTALCVPAQAQYQKLYTADTALRSPLTLTPLPDGNLVQSGLYGTFNAQGIPQLRAFYVHKTNSQGTTLWARTYTTDSLFTTISAVQPLPDGNLILFGGYAQHVLLVKMDTDGHVLWKKAYPSLRYQEPDGIFSTNPTRDGFTVLPDGGFAAVTTRPPTLADGGLNLTLFDAQGNLQWTRTYQVGTDQFANTVCLHNQQEGGFVVVGFSNEQNCYALNVIKTTAQGDTLWTRRYQNDCNKILWGIGAWQAPSGRINVLAQTYASAGSPAQLIAIALESGTGAVHHANRLTPADTATTFVSINFSQLGIGAGGNAVIPQTVNTPAGLQGVLLHLDTNLELIGTTRYANRLNPAVTYAFAAAFTPDEELPVVAGTTLAPGGTFATWVVAPLPDGTTTEPREYFATLPLNRQAIALATTAQCTILAPTPPAAVQPPLTDKPLAIAEQTARLGKPIPTLIAVDDHRNAAPGDTVVLNVFDNDLYTGIDNLRFFQNPQPVGDLNPNVQFSYQPNGDVIFVLDTAFTDSVALKYTVWDGSYAAQSEAFIIIQASTIAFNALPDRAYFVLCPQPVLPTLTFSEADANQPILLDLPAGTTINIGATSEVVANGRVTYTLPAGTASVHITHVPICGDITYTVSNSGTNAGSTILYWQPTIQLSTTPSPNIEIPVTQCPSVSGTYTLNIATSNFPQDFPVAHVSVPITFAVPTGVTLSGQGTDPFSVPVNGQVAIPLTATIACTLCDNPTINHTYSCVACPDVTVTHNINVVPKHLDPEVVITRTGPEIPAFCQGGWVVYTYTVRNTGEGPARIRSLDITANGGELVRDVEVGDILNPTETRTIRIRYPVEPCQTGSCNFNGQEINNPGQVSVGFSRLCPTNAEIRFAVFDAGFGTSPVVVNRLTQTVQWISPTTPSGQAQGYVEAGQTFTITYALSSPQDQAPGTCFQIESIPASVFTLSSTNPQPVPLGGQVSFTYTFAAGERCTGPDRLLELEIPQPFILRYGSSTACSDVASGCTTTVNVNTKCPGLCTKLLNTELEGTHIQRTTTNGEFCCHSAEVLNGNADAELQRAYRGDRVRFQASGSIVLNDLVNNVSFTEEWDNLERLFCVLQYNYDNPVGNLESPFEVFTDEVQNGTVTFSWTSNSTPQTRTFSTGCSARPFNEPTIGLNNSGTAELSNLWYFVDLLTAVELQQLKTALTDHPTENNQIQISFSGEFTVAFGQALRPGVTPLDIRAEFMGFESFTGTDSNQRIPDLDFQPANQRLTRSCDASYTVPFQFLRPRQEPVFLNPPPTPPVIALTPATVGNLCASQPVTIAVGPFGVSYAGASGTDDFEDETRALVEWGNGLTIQLPQGVTYASSALTYTRTSGNASAISPLTPTQTGQTLSFACTTGTAACTGPTALDVQGGAAVSEQPVVEQAIIQGTITVNVPIGCTTAGNTYSITATHAYTLNPYLTAAAAQSPPGTTCAATVSQPQAVLQTQALATITTPPSAFTYTLGTINHFWLNNQSIAQVPVTLPSSINGIAPRVEVTVTRGSNTITANNCSESNVNSPVRFVTAVAPAVNQLPNTENPGLDDISNWTALPPAPSGSGPGRQFRIQFPDDPCQTTTVTVRISVPCPPESSLPCSPSTQFCHSVETTVIKPAIVAGPNFGNTGTFFRIINTANCTTTESYRFSVGTFPPEPPGTNIFRAVIRVPLAQANDILFEPGQQVAQPVDLGGFRYYFLHHSYSTSTILPFRSCRETGTFCLAGLNPCTEPTPEVLQGLTYQCRDYDNTPSVVFNAAPTNNFQQVCLTETEPNQISGTITVLGPQGVPFAAPRVVLYLPPGLIPEHQPNPPATPVTFVQDPTNPQRWTLPIHSNSILPTCTLSENLFIPVRFTPTCSLALGPIRVESTLMYNHSGCNHFESPRRSVTGFNFSPTNVQNDLTVNTVQIAPETLACAAPSSHTLTVHLSGSYANPGADNPGYIGVQLPDGLTLAANPPSFETLSGNPGVFYVPLANGQQEIAIPVAFNPYSESLEACTSVPIRAFYAEKVSFPCLSCSLFISVDDGKTTTVTVCPPVTVSATAIDALCNGGVGSVNASAVGGTGSYTFSGVGLTFSGSVASGVSAGTYVVIATDGNGCTGSVSVTVNLSGSVTVSVSGTTVVCSGQTTMLTASGATTYTWSPATGLTDPNIANPTFNGTANTTYTVTGTDANGCTGTATLTVTVNPNPALSVSGTLFVCPNQSTTFTITGATTYTITPSPPTLQQPSAGVFTGVRANPSYTVTGTDANGCTGTISVSVANYSVSISIEPSSGTGVCPGTSVTLTATNTPAQSYTWQPGNLTGASITVSPTQTTTYTLSAQFPGCIRTATRTITVSQKPELTLTATTAQGTPIQNLTVCSGTPIQLTVCDATHPANPAFTWTGTSGAGLGNPITGTGSCRTRTATPVWNTTNNGQITYQVIRNNSGCRDTATMTVTVLPLPATNTAAINQRTTPCGDGTRVLTATNALAANNQGLVYAWSTGDTGPQIEVPAAGGTYTLTTTNEAGCSAAQTVTVPQAAVTPPPCTGATLTITANFDFELLQQLGIPLPSNINQVIDINPTTTAGICTLVVNSPQNNQFIVNRRLKFENLHVEMGPHDVTWFLRNNYLEFNNCQVRMHRNAAIVIGNAATNSQIRFLNNTHVRARNSNEMWLAIYNEFDPNGSPSNNYTAEVRNSSIRDARTVFGFVGENRANRLITDNACFDRNLGVALFVGSSALVPVDVRKSFFRGGVLNEPVTLPDLEDQVYDTGLAAIRIVDTEHPVTVGETNGNLALNNMNSFSGWAVPIFSIGGPGNSPGLTVQNALIRNLTRPAVWSTDPDEGLPAGIVGGLMGPLTDGLTVRRCVFHDMERALLSAGANGFLTFGGADAAQDGNLLTDIGRTPIFPAVGRSAVQLTNVSSPTLIRNNRFRNCFHGVELDLVSSTCTVQENTFIPGNGGTPVFGLTATGLGYTGALEVVENRFDGLHEAVSLRNVNGPSKLVSRNHITRLTDRLTDPALPPTGIRVQESVPATIVDNVVLGDPASPGTATRGLFLHNSKQTIVGCNRFAGLGIGLEARFDCLNSTLTNNVFRSCSTGLQLTDNGVLGAQGNPTASNNNVWSQCQVGLTSRESDGRQSPFFVPPAGSSQLPTNPDYFTNPIDGSVLAETLIVPQGIQTCGAPIDQLPCNFDIIECSACQPQPATCGQPTGYVPVWPAGLRDSIGTELHGYWRVATDRHHFPAFDAEGRYQAQAWLYDELRRKPHCRHQYPELDSFCQSHLNTDLHRLQLVDERLRAHDTLTAQLLNETVEPANLPQANLKAFNTLYLQLQAAQAHRQAERQRRTEAALAALVDTTNPRPALPSLPFGLADPQPAWSITPDQLTVLRALADQCPLEGGTAVYRARALRTWFDGHATPYTDDCPQTPEQNLYRLIRPDKPTRHAPGTEPQATLYPNPATDHVTIHYRYLEPQAWLQVTTLTGQPIARIGLPDTTGLQTLNTAAWVPGLYLCRIHNPNGHTLHTTKLLITR